MKNKKQLQTRKKHQFRLFTNVHLSFCALFLGSVSVSKGNERLVIFEFYVCKKNSYSLCTSTYNPRPARIAYLNFGYSFIRMVTIPTCGKNPWALPTTSSCVSHSCPFAYRPLSSTWLLSPLVRNLTVLFWSPLKNEIQIV